MNWINQKKQRHTLYCNERAATVAGPIKDTRYDTIRAAGTRYNNRFGT